MPSSTRTTQTPGFKPSPEEAKDLPEWLRATVDMDPVQPLRRRSWFRERWLELTLVLAVCGVAWTVAVPRMARAGAWSAVSADEQALVDGLAILRTAIDAYRRDHGEYPAEDLIVQQLMMYTSSTGLVSPIKDQVHAYGPYMQFRPHLPLGRWMGSTTIGPQGTYGAGWIYNQANGFIHANTAPDETDANGKVYSAY